MLCCIDRNRNNKPVIMFLTFCGAFDVLHCKKEDKVVAAMVDLCDQNMGGFDSSNQVMYPYAFERGENHGKKNLKCLLMNSYILYKLTVGHPKTRLEFIKDVIDSPVSDYKETVAVSVARN